MNIHSYISTKLVQDREAVKILKILADETRFQILKLLISKGKKELCVSEIALAIGMTQSATSHQLAKLESSGALYATRHGQNVCYELSREDITRKIRSIIKHLS